MELRVLKYFLTVASERNITRAAEKLNITQPSLSRQLKQLEEELGVKLFERGKKGLMLTDDGLFLKQRAKEIVGLSDKTKQDFYEHSDSVSGILSIGCTETLAAAVLPELLKNFSQLYPDVHYELFNGNSDDVKERLDKGLIDIGLVFEPINAEKYEYKRIVKPIAWGTLINKNDELAESDVVTASQLTGRQLILPSSSQKAELVNWLKSSEESPNIIITYNTISSAVLLAKNGVGCAVCPETAYKIADSSVLCFRPLSPERLSAGAFIWKKEVYFTPTARKMIEYICNAF